ncbi:MAG: tetratricopeptide repeat protein [Cyclobacteriaceae bacterium]
MLDLFPLLISIRQNSFYLSLLLLISCNDIVSTTENDDESGRGVFIENQVASQLIQFDSIMEYSLRDASDQLLSIKSTPNLPSHGEAIFHLKKAKYLRRITHQDGGLSHIDSAIAIGRRLDSDTILYHSYLAKANMLKSLDRKKSTQSYYDSAVFTAIYNGWNDKVGHSFVDWSEHLSFIWQADSAMMLLDIADTLFSHEKDRSGLLRSRHFRDYAVYRSSKLHEALERSLETGRMADSLGEEVIRRQATGLQAHIYDHWGDYSPAIERYEQLLADAEQRGNLFDIYAWLSQLTYAHRMMGNYDKAIGYGNLCVEICDSLQYDMGKAVAYIRLYQIYHDNKQIEKELAAVDSAMAIHQKYHYDKGIAVAYNSYGNAYESQGKYKQAFEAYENALALQRPMPPSHWVVPLYNLGNTKLFLDQPAESIPYFEESLEICNTQGIIGMKVRNLLGLAEAKMKLGENLQSVSLVEEAERLVVKTKYQRMKRDAYELLAEIYAANQMYDQAYYAHILHKKLEDSLFNESSNKRFANLQVQFETQKKEQENALLKKDLQLEQSYSKSQTQIAMVVGLLFILAVVVGIAIYMQKNKVEQKNKLIASQNNLIGQRNDRIETLLREVHHRVKNNLQLITSLLDVDVSEHASDNALDILKESQNRVATMSLIHQNLYMNDDFNQIDVKDYIEQLVTQLTEINALQSDITFELKCADYYFDVDTMVPMGLLLTELITNAFKYSMREENGYYLSIALEEIGVNRYHLAVADKGKNLPKPLDDLVQNGYGLRLASRLSLQLSGELTHEYHDGNHFSVIFSHENQQA